MSNETLSPYVIEGDHEVVRYTHPYLFTRDQGKTVTVWSCANASKAPSACGTLESGQLGWPMFTYVLSPQHIVIHSYSQEAFGTSTLSVYSIPDVQLLDSLQLGYVNGIEPDEPEAGQTSLLGVVDGRIAVWTNGSTSANGFIRIYTPAENGKLTVLQELHPAPGGPALAVDSVAREYLTPQLVHLTADDFVGSLVFHPSSVVHLVRWSSQTSQAVAHSAEFACTRTVPDFNGVMHASLQDHLFVSSTNAIITAHYEYPLDFVDHAPVTAIRSLDSSSLKLNWCTSVNQKVDALRYSAAAGVVLATGVIWKDGGGEWGIIVLDAQTGDTRRVERIGQPKTPCGKMSGGLADVSCDVTPSGENLVVVFGDGQLATCSVAQFVEHGLAREEDVDEDGLRKVTTLACADVPLSEPTNSKARTQARKAKENGRWRWVDAAFIGDGQVILKPESGRGFATLSFGEKRAD
ncbi:hypothetical protein HGRIS_014768 [Hohenbuehelia grisea]|uniref:Uncharacterized protein n=1 Tax=Hohenbuehelia grisea TaxID=104357 RepID=A0ABR3IQP1_9AGAR